MKKPHIVLSLFLLVGLSGCVTAPELYTEQYQSKDLDDADDDGVINARDLCPETPLDAVINNDGCPNTSDRPKINFRVILFGFDEDFLTEEEERRVVEIAQFLNKYTVPDVYLIGDTSIEGSKSYNDKLAQRRIATVNKILLENNVDEKRLKKEVFSLENHLPEALKGRSTRLIAVLKWPDGYKDYEVEWTIFTEREKLSKL